MAEPLPDDLRVDASSEWQGRVSAGSAGKRRCCGRDRGRCH